MHFACDKVQRMPHVQIRNVPEDLHRKLKARAASAGMSLSEYLLAEVRRSAETPTLEEIVERVRGRKLYRFKERSAEIVRREREARDRR
jgi:plasmid stability protein